MIKAIILEDEQLALEHAKLILNEHKEIEIIGTFSDPFVCLETIKKEEMPQIAFLDIQMPKINGLEVAQRLVEIEPNIHIVFFTAYDVYAVDAFELNALDYIMKPLKKERIEKTIDKYKKHVLATQGYSATTKLKTLRLQLSDYLSFEIEKDKFQPIEWRTAKSQELFIYLLQNAGCYIEKDVLMELLWRDKNLDSSAALLYTNIYNVRKALKPFGDHFILKNCLDGYMFELNNVKTDVLEWEKAAKTLEPITDEKVIDYKEHIERFENKYLLKHDYVWLEVKRESLNKLWKSLIDRVVYFYTNNKQYNEAIQFLGNLVEHYKDDEQLHFSLMKLYVEIGDIDAVSEQYRSLILYLRKELDMSPSMEIQTWYKRNVMKKLTINVQNINGN